MGDGVGLPGTVMHGRADGPGGAAAVLSFNMPPARDLAAPAARSGNGLQPMLTRRDAHASSATQPATQEVRHLHNLRLIYRKICILWVRTSNTVDADPG